MSLLRFFLVGAFVFSLNTLSAQPPDPGDPVPITGIEILVGAGAFFGVKRLLDSRKNKS